MRKIYMLAGLLLCSAPVFAQSVKKSAVPEGKVAVSVMPALPGEEKLSAQERAERDFLMPTRRKRTAAHKAGSTEQASAAEVTARNSEAEEAAPAEESSPAEKATATHSYRRPFSVSRRRSRVSSSASSRSARASSRHPATKSRATKKKTTKKASAHKSTAKKATSRKSSTKKSTARKSVTHKKTSSTHHRRR